MTGFKEWLEGKDTDNMAGFSHVRRMLLGDIDSIDKLAILTAANPQAQMLSNRENWELMSDLEADLRQNNYGPIRVSGQYGHKEPSFIVPHMSRDEVINLGKKYNQESVIYGEKFINGEGQTAMRFDLIDCAHNAVISTRCRTLGNDIQNNVDCFTKVKGRKFNIPFFDNQYANDSNCI